MCTLQVYDFPLSLGMFSCLHVMLLQTMACADLCAMLYGSFFMAKMEMSDQFELGFLSQMVCDLYVCVLMKQSV